MVDEESSVESFIKHMRDVEGKVRNVAALRNYANLIHSGLAAIPGLVCRQERFKLALLPWVSRCLVCNEPVARELNGCDGCTALYVQVRTDTRAALARHRDDFFYCLSETTVEGG